MLDMLTEVNAAAMERPYLEHMPIPIVPMYPHSLRQCLLQGSPIVSITSLHPIPPSYLHV